ncbi:transposase, partial [Acinetobacter pittii]
KRHTYGSVIVDHDTGEILELIDSRDSSIVANVLKQYKKVNTITRDRGRCFIKAIKQGAPSAHAITDKFH